VRPKQRVISDHVPGVKGCDVGSRRKKRFAAASSGRPGTDVVSVAVAHLRCTAAAAIQLRDAIDKALWIGAPAKPLRARRTDAGTTFVARAIKKTPPGHAPQRSDRAGGKDILPISAEN
jgi:hypothetical protein